MYSLRGSKALVLAVGLVMAGCKSKEDVPAPRAAKAPESSAPAESPSPAEPRARKPEPALTDSGWAIVLASAPQREEAEARLRAMHEARAFAFVKPSEGFPKVLESSSLPGLRPGLHVVVLGVCGVQGEALAAQKRVRPELNDAYVKKLTGSAELSCPLPVDQDSKLPRGAERLASLPFEGTPGLTLTAYRANEHSEMECSASDLIIRLMFERQVLAETLLAGSCSGACTPEAKKEKAARVEELKQAIAEGEADDSELDYNFTACQGFETTFERALDGLGNPVFIVSEAASGPHGAIRYVFRLVGVGCGAINVSEPFVGAGASFYVANRESGEDLEARPASSNGPGWKRFSLFKPEATADAGTGRLFADVEWVGARCEWQVKGGE